MVTNLLIPWNRIRASSELPEDERDTSSGENSRCIYHIFLERGRVTLLDYQNEKKKIVRHVVVFLLPSLLDPSTSMLTLWAARSQ